MKPLDYGRSFLIGTAPWNRVRFWVESRTRIIDKETGKSEDYIQAASCKSEATFAKENLFVEDNYDFLPVFGPEYGIMFRRKAWLNTDYKSCMTAENMWGGIKYHLVEAGQSEQIVTFEKICDATCEFTPIVAQTEIWNNTTKLHAVIEYPVKTMNTRAEDDMYQVDTGPIVLPDLSKRYERNVDAMSLAFVAFNAPDFSYFVLEEPTEIPKEGGGEKDMCKVYHYSKLQSVPALNRLYAVS